SKDQSRYAAGNDYGYAVLRAVRSGARLPPHLRYVLCDRRNRWWHERARRDRAAQSDHDGADGRGDKNPQISNYPYEFATDMSTQAQTWSGASQGVGNLTSAGQLFVYPATSGSIILTHRYMVKQPDLVNPSTNV